MPDPVAMPNRWIVLGILVVEAFGWLKAEVLAQHFGTFGIRFHRFLAHRLIRNCYSPRTKLVVATFVAFAATKHNDSGALEIANLALDADASQSVG